MRIKLENYENSFSIQDTKISQFRFELGLSLHRKLDVYLGYELHARSLTGYSYWFIRTGDI